MANPARAIRFPDDLDAFILAEVERTQGSVSTVVTALVRRAMDGGEAQPGAPPGPPPKPTLDEMRAGLETSGFVVTPLAEFHKLVKVKPAEAAKLSTEDHIDALRAAGIKVTRGSDLAPRPQGQPTAGRIIQDALKRTRVNTPDRKPPKGAVFLPTERTAGMSKNAVVRPSLKTRRIVGFDSDGKEVWG